MEIKGTGLITTRDFVKEHFSSQYNEWLNTLPLNTQTMYLGVIDSRKWYPIKGAYIDALEHTINMFFNGDVSVGADKVGAYSAQKALNGVYKAFLFISSPNYLMQRAAKMLSTFYNECKVEIVDAHAKGFKMRLIEFGEITKSIEYRIGGWSRKALELTNCKNVKYTLSKSLTNNDAYTEYIFSWD